MYCLVLDQLQVVGEADNGCICIWDNKSTVLDAKATYGGNFILINTPVPCEYSFHKITEDWQNVGMEIIGGFIKTDNV